MKNKIRGWKEIFSFTVVQSLKAKSMKIGTLVLCLIALVSVPVLSLMTGEEKQTEKTSIKTVKVVDMTGLNLLADLEVLKSEDLYEENENKLYTSIQYETADIDFEKLAQGAESKEVYTFDEDADYVYLQIVYSGNNPELKESDAGFDIQVIYSNDTTVKKQDVTEYNEFVNEHFRKVLLQNLQLTDEQQELVNSVQVTKYQSDIEKEQENANEKADDEKTEKAKYNIIYATLMVVMFALAFGGERIAMSIITEKASKVMEYLMTSVQPMAIVIGKILANILILFIQAGLILVSFILSLILNGIIHSDGGKLISLPSYITNIFSMTNFSGFTPLNLLLALIIFIGGFIFFGLVAGLAGASVSKMDEIAEGVKMYTMLLIIGAYVAIFIVTSNMYDGTSAIRYFAMLFPLTSVFLTPASLLTGYVTLAEALISAGIMIVAILLLTKFVANVYESMVYYNGSPLKLKDIINISKQNGKQKNSRRKEDE